MRRPLRPILLATLLTLGGSFGDYLDSGHAPSAGHWQHVAATYDGTIARFYLDGGRVLKAAVWGVCLTPLAGLLYRFWTDDLTASAHFPPTDVGPVQVAEAPPQHGRHHEGHRGEHAVIGRERMNQLPAGGFQRSLHGSVCTSTESTGGRSRTIGAQLSPASTDAYTCPPVVPK